MTNIFLLYYNVLGILLHFLELREIWKQFTVYELIELNVVETVKDL